MPHSPGKEKLEHYQFRELPNLTQLSASDILAKIKHKGISFTGSENMEYLEYMEYIRARLWIYSDPNRILHICMHEVIPNRIIKYIQSSPLNTQ